MTGPFGDYFVRNFARDDLHTVPRSISQKLIARFCNTTRGVVNKQINAWVHKDYIEKRETHYAIKQAHKIVAET